MKLGELLNKFRINGFFEGGFFLLTVNGLCDELPSDEIDEMMKEDFFKPYRYMKVLHLSIIDTNMTPELCIKVDRDDEDSFARRNYFR